MKATLTAIAALMIAAAPAFAQAPAFVEKQTPVEVLSSDLVGTPIAGMDGVHTGKIANLVFDEHGRIELVVIGVGGMLGVGEKYVAVPFSAVKPGEAGGKRVFYLDATKEQLKAAPTYQTLSEMALNERIKDWREKAEKSWADVKAGASQALEQAKDAYHHAKEKVEPAEKPKE